MKRMDKRGANILTENIIFIVLNLIFFTVLIAFLFLQAGGAGLLEESHAKQIALVIDASKPGMELQINVDDAIKKAEDENFLGEIFTIQDNLVTVQLTEKSGHSYSFFNDISISNYDLIKEDGNNFLVILTGEYHE